MTATAAAPRRYIDLLEGIELATRVITSAGGDPPTAAEWLRYRARLYRRLDAECPRSQSAGTALLAAEADERRAAEITERTPAS